MGGVNYYKYVKYNKQLVLLLLYMLDLEKAIKGKDQTIE